YIVGEIIRRVTGKPISEVLRDELSGPLGVEKELYFGMPRSEHHRLAVLEDTPLPPDFQMPAMPPDLPMFKAAPMSLMPNAAFGVGGVGGSFAGCDAATGIAFAVTKNRLANDFNAATQIIGLVTKR